jgi:hypothetical protein
MARRRLIHRRTRSSRCCAGCSESEPQAQSLVVPFQGFRCGLCGGWAHWGRSASALRWALALALRSLGRVIRFRQVDFTFPESDTLRLVARWRHTASAAGEWSAESRIRTPSGCQPGRTPVGQREGLGIFSTIVTIPRARLPVALGPDVRQCGLQTSIAEKQANRHESIRRPRRLPDGRKMAAVCRSRSPGGDRLSFSTVPESASDPGGGDPPNGFSQSGGPGWRTHPGRVTQDLSPADPRYGDEEPLWSAEGRHIWLCRIDRRDKPTLWRMGADGWEPVRVAGVRAIPAVAAAATPGSAITDISTGAAGVTGTRGPSRLAPLDRSESRTEMAEEGRLPNNP